MGCSLTAFWLDRSRPATSTLDGCLGPERALRRTLPEWAVIEVLQTGWRVQTCGLDQEATPVARGPESDGSLVQGIPGILALALVAAAASAMASSSPTVFPSAVRVAGDEVKDVDGCCSGSARFCGRGWNGRSCGSPGICAAGAGGLGGGRRHWAGWTGRRACQRPGSSGVPGHAAARHTRGQLRAALGQAECASRSDAAADGWPGGHRQAVLRRGSGIRREF
ncbi:hypothetical protein BOO71_0001888 [Deinococcus marmoris]|uniref:Uncharacterized protein n=1 Tax=Deinococcus marmoris TaxID=249408 RepID=A0A1U7P3H0_9DEIO|nr:hypothetical protein BOO71_0001888 [Deinococcus marmoris]